MVSTYAWIFSFGHAIVDIGQGFLPIITPRLAEKMDLSFFQVGIIAFAFTFSSALIQPIFGVLSDRFRMTWLMPAGLLISGIGLGLTGLVNSYALLILVLLFGGMGVAAYHPEASKMTHLVSRGNNAGASMSIFSLGGNLGFAIGPVLATFILGFSGLNSVPGIIIPGLLAAVFFFFLMPRFKQILHEKYSKEEKIEITSISKEDSGITKTSDLQRQKQKFNVLLLIIYVTIRSWVHSGLIYFIPFYYPSFKGVANPEYLVTIFLFAGVFGTLIGGPLADRFGERRVLLISMIISLLTVYPFVYMNGHWITIFAFILGTSLISTFPVTVVFAQKLMPDNIGLASGLILGFALGMGSVGVSLLGIVADIAGLHLAMNIICFIPIIGIALSLTLPELKVKKAK
ncbi:MAG: MFS transporter [Eubacteriales bacterium]|nr:MFS transporter [Eubacteriales bacterium]